MSFALASPEEGGGAPPGVAVPVFQVDDLEAALAQTGAAATPIRDMGDHGRTALVTDPQGTRFALFQSATTG